MNGVEKQTGKQAVAYCRVSSKAQLKRGDGLNSQQTRCLEYARFRGYSIINIYTDDITGAFLDRPGLQAMLKFLRANRKEGIVCIVDDISRMARHVGTHWDLRDLIRDAGGILESPSFEFKDDADSRMVENVLAGAAQHQREKNREQTINRMRARVQNGYWCFQPPIGFKHKTVSGHGRLLVRNEPLASIIQEALEGYASGYFDTQVEVKRFLESQPDFPKDLPNGEIRNQRITDILKRAVYAGMVEAPGWNVSRREGRHEGLISYQTYLKIQERLAGGAKSPARKDISAEFPLRNSVLCGDCEKPLTSCWSKSKTGKKHPYYFCFNKACSSHRKSIRREQLEGDFEKLVGTLQPTVTMFEMVKAMFKDGWEKRSRYAAAIANSAGRELNRIDKQIEGLLDRIVDATNPSVISAYEKRISKLENEKLVIKEKADHGVEEGRPFNELFELAMRFLSNPVKLLHTGRLEDIKTLIRLSFEERLVYCRKSGFRTPKTTLPFRALGAVCRGEIEMARPKGFEPLTPRFVVWCSIQLSYGRAPGIAGSPAPERGVYPRGAANCKRPE